jgi:hypothetical protein
MPPSNLPHYELVGTNRIAFIDGLRKVVLRLDSSLGRQMLAVATFLGDVDATCL